MGLRNKLSLANIKNARQQLTQPAPQLDNPDNIVLDKTLDFLKQVEGYEPEVYQDSNLKPTFGIGANLQSPATQEAAKALKFNTDELKRSGISPEQSDMLARKTLELKHPEFKRIKEQSFPGAKLNHDQEAALMSLYYNNPKLLGPLMRGYLDTNDVTKVSKEILLRSNKNKRPGIAKRRLAEAEMFAGESFPEVMKAFSPDEKKELLNLIENIKNPNEKARVLEKYLPFLS